MTLPPLYFRIRENGAAVFRVDAGNRNQRIEMEQIATVNVRNGEVRPHGDRPLTAEDKAAIADWLAERRRLLADREADEVRRTVDHLNLTAQWAQSKATDAEIAAVSDALLLAMHDLRSVLVRRTAERIEAKGNQDPTGA